ncbi:MAG: FAD-binding oxidoreductase [Clostridia bacterium]|jgi:sarcosine oxidase subunit beta|nr:FAD-binding oxidoreductase [Clostridia bacterium]
MKKKADVCIVGGGVIGCSIAWNLAKRGKKVILVEKTDHASGASGACDQFIILQSKNPGVHLELALAGAKMYETLEEELGADIAYHKDGGMILIETAEEMKIMEEFVAKQRKIGLEVEILDQKAAAKRQRGLAPHLVGSTYSAQDAHVDPIRLNFALARAAVLLGAEILLETEVNRIIKDGPAVVGVRTNKGDEIYAPLVINAAGAWAPLVGELAGLKIPIEPRRGQIVITEPVPPFITGDILSAQYIVAKYNADLIQKSDSLPVRLGVGLALSQTEKGNIMIGATREFVGYDRSNTPEGLQEVLKNACRLVPGLKEINFIRFISGLRPYTKDGLPLVGHVQDVPGFFMAAGHEGDGIALSPVTGRIVADLICEGKTFMDISALDPHRFSPAKE